MTGRARAALWLLKPKASSASPARRVKLQNKLIGNIDGGWSTLMSGSFGRQMSTAWSAAGPRACTRWTGHLKDQGVEFRNPLTRERFTGTCRSSQRRHLASEREKVDNDRKPRPKLVESTRKLREQVQSRLANLTPHENIYTVPNALTFSRLLAAPAIGYLVLHDYHAWAVGLFAYAGITDLVDGYIARQWKLQTVVGSVIDPMADKGLMFILTVCLAAKGAIPRMSEVVYRRNQIPMLTFPSVSCDSHPWPRCLSRHRCYLLPLRFASSSKDLLSVLGLFPSISRSASHYCQQIQYLPSAHTPRCDHCPPSGHR